MITYEDFSKNIKHYSKNDLEQIRKAYDYADILHDHQYRESGEPYITHPLSVAYILSEMHADADTLCAALLHDTIEDTQINREEIEEEFNHDVAILVDGVTKLKKMNFTSSNEQVSANTRKIVTSISEDVRIIIIKLADRLHNMRTLQYKRPFKQQENALETMQIFVPLAYYIGAYRIKSELEDLSLQYLNPNAYQTISELKNKHQKESHLCLNEMYYQISNILNNHNINNTIKVRTKNIYGIYRKLEEGLKLEDIHDLLSLKVMTKEIPECYLSLGLIHQKYFPINNRFKDYICNPKTNMYSSLHTTVFGPQERLVQVQIRTYDMDKVASFGLTAYWDTKNKDARDIMQRDIKEKYQFYNSLSQIDNYFKDNNEYVKQLKSELFSSNIYVYTTKGVVIQLPYNATPIDLAYSIDTTTGDTIEKVFVNDQEASLNTILHNKDRVRIITNPNKLGLPLEMLQEVKTTKAKTRIKELNHKK